jgi:peptidyl-prolyl cis-trans isomerase SurA
LKVSFLTKAALVVALLLITSTTVPGQQRLKEGDRLDAVLGVVGKYPILKSTIDGKLELLMIQQGIAKISNDSMMQLRQRLLNAEVDEKVLLAKADQDSITVSEAEVDDRLQQQIKLYVRQLGSEDAVEKQFGKTIAQIKSSPELRDRARESILIEQERYKAVPNSTSISRHDVEQFYALYRDSLPKIGKEVELATIIKFVKPQANQAQRTKAFALSLLDSLKHGADFATLARKYSQHATAKNGGDLGDYYARGTFLPEFEAAAFKLKTGEVSGVVETEQGFHIIKMIDRRGEEIHVAQILLKPNASSADEEVARNQLLTIRERLNKGEDFGKLASTESDDQETKFSGGSLGKLRIEDLAPEQREVVDSLKEGEVSLPLHIQLSRTVTGYQVVKLVRNVPPHAVSLETDYRELEATAIQWKQNRDFGAYVVKARSNVYVKLNDIRQFY